MIMKAKVSLSSVHVFQQAVQDIRDYSSKLERGISCFNKLIQYLDDVSEKIKNSISDLSSAQNTVSVKIRTIEEEIRKVENQLAKHQEELERLRIQAENMSRTIAIPGAEGQELEVPNPAYEDVEAEIYHMEGIIQTEITQRDVNRQKLDRAKELNTKISAQIQNHHSVIDSLSQKKADFQRLKEQLQKIKELNGKRGTLASDKLKKIEQIISEYLRIKMNYNGISIPGGYSFSSKSINVNININRQISVDRKNTQKLGNDSNTNAPEDGNHQVRYDSNGHICEYDGRRFGGIYNAYEFRLNLTSKNDPILGQYTGIRGESKYIPSARTAEGVVVLNILSEYGLDGINYRNAEPDFEDCAEAVVTIKDMTENRYDYKNSDGTKKYGNFSQADIELAKIWNFEEKDGRSNWRPRDIYNYRKANNLTWHEKCDTVTMVLVRREINDYFNHSGGCAECKARDGHTGGGFDE